MWYPIQKARYTHTYTRTHIHAQGAHHCQRHVVSHTKSKIHTHTHTQTYMRKELIHAQGAHHCQRHVVSYTKSCNLAKNNAHSLAELRPKCPHFSDLCVCVCVFVCVCVCVCVFMYTVLLAAHDGWENLNARTVYMYVCMYACMYVYVWILFLTSIQHWPGLPWSPPGVHLSPFQNIPAPPLPCHTHAHAHTDRHWCGLASPQHKQKMWKHAQQWGN